MAWSHEEFVWGFEPPEEFDGAVGATHHPYAAQYQSGTVRPVVLLGKFRNASDGDITKLKDREDVGHHLNSLLSPTFKGGLTHFFAEMSYRNLTLEAGGIHTTWVESQSRSRSDYNMADDCTGWSDAQLTFVKEVIRNAEGSVDFNAQVYDSETPRDMMVDMVMVVLPRAFGRPTDHQRCPNGTVFYASSLSDLTVDGVGIEIVITSTYSSSMSFISAVLAHEYGHAMGLPELFDRDKAPDGATDEDRHDIESGGIGNWGVMGGATGWPHPDPAKDEVSTGPNPFSVWRTGTCEVDRRLP